MTCKEEHKKNLQGASHIQCIKKRSRVSQDVRHLLCKNTKRRILQCESYVCNSEIAESGPRKVSAVIYEKKRKIRVPQGLSNR